MRLLKLRKRWVRCRQAREARYHFSGLDRTFRNQKAASKGLYQAYARDLDQVTNRLHWSDPSSVLAEYLRELQRERSEEEAKRKPDGEKESKHIAWRLVYYIADEFKKEQGVDLRNDSLALQRLREAVENAMHELT